MTRLDPKHPGEVLKHDFMVPLGLSAAGLTGAIGVTAAQIDENVRGRRGRTYASVKQSGSGGLVPPARRELPARTKLTTRCRR